MDPDLLISLVFVRKPIWDKRDKLHALNRIRVEKLWKEIATEMGLEDRLNTLSSVSNRRGGGS